MKLDYPIIKDWAIVSNRSEDNSLEFISHHIQGKVFGHPIYGDNYSITTSRIVRFIAEQGIILVQTENSMYLLTEENISERYNEFYNGQAFSTLMKQIEDR